MIGNFRFGVKKKLLQLRLRAEGSGSCFTVLSQIELALFDLTTKVVEEVYILKLEEALFSIIKKLEGASEGTVLRMLKQVGFPQARKLSLYMQKARNVFARNWASAIRLPRFSGVMYINDTRSASLTEYRS
jgi:hypothetical protein